MDTYILEAVLNDDTVINLNFLFDHSPSLLEIDQLTNQYKKWDFIYSLRNYLSVGDIDIISSFRISIKGKDYSYSTVFQNSFLSPVLNQVVDNKKSRKYEVSFHSSSFSDMKRFLFDDLNQGGKIFSEYYQYHNRLFRLVNKYLSSSSDNEEDMHQKKLLEEMIVKELTNYKTYRSLCVYRNNLDRRINSVYHGVKPVTNVKPKPQIFSSNTFTLDKENSFSYSGYQQIYVDGLGDEKEEFLDLDEIEEMGNYYGK